MMDDINNFSIIFLIYLDFLKIIFETDRIIVMIKLYSIYSIYSFRAMEIFQINDQIITVQSMKRIQ